MHLSAHPALRSSVAHSKGDILNQSQESIELALFVLRRPYRQFALYFTHNLFVLFKHSALGKGWRRHRVATVRWRLFQVPGRLVRHAGAWVLKVAATVAEDFAAIRSRAYACMHDPAPG